MEYITVELALRNKIHQSLGNSNKHCCGDNALLTISPGLNE